MSARKIVKPLFILLTVLSLGALVLSIKEETTVFRYDARIREIKQGSGIAGLMYSISKKAPDLFKDAKWNDYRRAEKNMTDLRSRVDGWDGFKMRTHIMFGISFICTLTFTVLAFKPRLGEMDKSVSGSESTAGNSPFDRL